MSEYRIYIHCILLKLVATNERAGNSPALLFVVGTHVIRRLETG